MTDVASLRNVVSDPRTPTLDVIAVRAVLAAIDGDLCAFKLIADLIDGPVRRRREEPDGSDADDSHRADVQALVVDVVTALTNRRLGLPFDSTVLDG